MTNKYDIVCVLIEFRRVYMSERLGPIKNIKRLCTIYVVMLYALWCIYIFISLWIERIHTSHM